MKQTYVDYKTRAIINLDLYSDGALVCRINTPCAYRGRGVMRKLISEMLADADREHVRLSLWIHASGSMSYDQLAAWYGRLGFVRTVWNDEPGLFVRVPR